MKKNISESWVNALIGVAVCSILFSFTPYRGAHSVQVYLDSKLVIDQYLDFHKSEAPKLALDPAKAPHELIVKYSECGRTVSGRKITLKDESNKVLKDWRFEGKATGYQEPMSCSVKDILAVKPIGAKTLKLYYSSADFPEGQQIAQLVIGNSTATASK